MICFLASFVSQASSNFFLVQQLLELGEHIGYVSTGVKEEVIKTKLKRGRRSHSMMGSPFDGENCCICQVRINVFAFLHLFTLNITYNFISKKTGT